MRNSKLVLAVVACALTVPVFAQDAGADALRAALAAAERSDEDRARDATRKPVEVLQFLGVSEGDTVLELFAAGGWYTQVLSAAVGDSGEVYAWNPEMLLRREGFLDREAALHGRLGNVTAVHGEVANAGIDGQADVALTALNLHDMYNRGGEAAAVNMLNGAFVGLRSGGILGVIDHRGSSGQPNADLHRMEQRSAESVIEAAGFVIEGRSEILANPDDDHSLGIRDASIRGKTDRFLIRARKP